MIFTSGTTSLDRFPQVDLPEGLADGLALTLQNAAILDTTHAISHQTSKMFALGHDALERAATAVLGNTERVAAMLTGCCIFEAVGGAVCPKDYSSPVELAAVHEVAMRFVAPAHLAKFTRRANVAGGLLCDEVPVLCDVVSQVAARSLSSAAIEYAIDGAGMMRSMQIQADRAL